MPDPTPPTTDPQTAATASELPPRLLAKLKVEIDGYELIERLGEGGQATVYRAIQKKDGRMVAVKVLHAGPHATEEARARLKREINALRAVNHPNIVHAIAAGRTRSGLDCLVMNYIDGKPLDTLWTDPAFAAAVAPQPADLLRLFKTICQTVQAAHRKGITHRDLSPSNILLDAQGRPHILDFGMASTAFDGIVTRDISMTGQFIGKLQYASPEQAKGAGSQTEGVDIRSDVYALGVMLYQLLTGGAFPYEVVGNVIDVLNNIIHSKPRPPSETIASLHTPAGALVTPRLNGSPRPTAPIRRNPPLVNETIEAIVLKSLEKDPLQRYQSAGELAADIDRYLAGQPTSATAWSERTTPPQHRSHRRAALTAASIFLVITLAGATMNAKQLSLWLGLTTAVAPIAPVEFQPLAPQPAEAAAPLYQPVDAGADSRLNKLAEDLAMVEAKLTAVSRQLVNVEPKFELPPDVKDGPLTYAAFVAKIAQASTEAGRTLQLPVMPTADFQRQIKIEAESIQRETDKDRLLDKRRELESQHTAIWGQLAYGTFTGREVDQVFRFRRKPDGDHNETIAARLKVFDTGVKVRRSLDSAFRSGGDALASQSIRVTGDRPQVFSSVADLPKEALVAFRQAASDGKSAGGPDDRSAMGELAELSRLLSDALTGAAESQGRMDKDDGERPRLINRARIQQDLLTAAATAAKLDQQLVALAKMWKVEPDRAAPLPAIETPKPPAPEKADSVLQYFVVGSSWEFDGGSFATVQSVNGNDIVLALATGGASVRTLRLQNRQNEIWLVSDSGMSGTIAPDGLNIRGTIVQGKLNLAGTRTILVAGQPKVENVTYVFVQQSPTKVVIIDKQPPAAKDDLSAWKVGTVWLNVADNTSKDDTWEISARTASTIEIRRKANKRDRDIIVTFAIAQNRSLTVSSLRYSSGVNVLRFGGSGTIATERLTSSLTWTTQGKGRRQNYNGNENLDLRPVRVR